MAYLINKEKLPIQERICAINNVAKEKLDVSNFFVFYDNPLLKDFVDKLLEHRDEKYFIVGDYDCDGICATSIIKKLLDDLSISNNYYIPSRTNEGYGLNMDIVNKVIDNDFKVMICVDCGVNSKEELAYAKAHNIKTFVIDHHEYDEAPDVDGFLHPNLFSEDYYDMCAGGLCCLISNSIRKDELTTVLGGLATLADMVTVLNYNRYLLKEMLKILNEGNIYQINLLANSKVYDYEVLSFNVIPKINSISRLDEYMNVNLVVRYLLSDEDYCHSFFKNIDTINDYRKSLTTKMADKAELLINNEDDFIIVADASFSQGICGLISNKLMNKYHKPVLVLAENGDEYVGSCRAPYPFDVYSYLKECESIFTAYGGHNQAVGLSINKDNLPILSKYITNHPFTIENVDEEILEIDRVDIDISLLEQINELKPFGAGFKEPLFMIDNIDYRHKYIVAKKYPKFFINNCCDAISFNSDYVDKVFSKIVGRIQKDNYHYNKISILIEDIMA